MNNALVANPHLSIPALRWREQSLYLWSTALVAGNLALPQLCHLLPSGGKMLLPIYFFTLIGTARFGWRAGVLTALASPLLNHLLFGMPPAGALAPIVVKSLLIAALTPLVLRHVKLLPLAAAAIVAAYQVPGSVFEWAWTQSATNALQDLTQGWPGMALQVLLGWAALTFIARRHDSHGDETL
ncbi:MAG: hypothetical protein LBV54_06425 [Puniceicoccales bacterium]|jgi:hypothetical protein|nr:hypothetical protein [Puniceicoccales bacterium]